MGGDGVTREGMAWDGGGEAGLGDVKREEMGSDRKRLGGRGWGNTRRDGMGWEEAGQDGVR